MMRFRTLATVACVALAGAVLLAREEIRIQPIPSKMGVVASFTARDGWTQGTREMVQQGAQVTFEFDVELRRPAPLLFFDALDPVLARARVSSSVKFDTLRGDYRVDRMRNGRVVKADRVKLEAEAREWLTTFDGVALDPVSPLEPNAEYYVYVSLTIRPRRVTSVWSILPLGRPDDSGRKKFAFVR